MSVDFVSEVLAGAEACFELEAEEEEEEAEAEAEAEAAAEEVEAAGGLD